MIKSETSLKGSEQNLSTSHQSLRAVCCTLILKNSNNMKWNKDKVEIPNCTFKLQSHRELSIHHSTFSLNRSAVNALSDKDTDADTIKTVAWLVIIGDSIHNFIDGVSIGAGFVKDFRTGAVISLAIVCEEFPHELGIKKLSISCSF